MEISTSKEEVIPIPANLQTPKVNIFALTSKVLAESSIKFQSIINAYEKELYCMLKLKKPIL
eukprot:CAMPEP_0114580662 /NCGR_PEP_ID=MMETSP0125-20121206/4898_1 /TAXON_ID=485358 ORGANISM="Aristerostoma sp., Strain ATCC 50986" /NCGR_SAMPLE_ID=MMETSP0125 /ASSEMBLY_ACC=CAM_ASM_000245 /LENGTH=61 /DNA_ID=CAMNT_0001772349 /DNA_START=755 /DNA_END=940 /DNA_ORIENTATION=+